MTWIAITTSDGQAFSAKGITGWDKTANRFSAGSEPAILRGSLVLETRLPPLNRPTPLLEYSADGSSGVHVALQALPQGGLTLVLNRGGEILHSTVNHSEAGRTDVLRLTYSWDIPNEWGRLALERTDQETVVLARVPNPIPLRAEEVLAICDPTCNRYLAPEVSFIAVSDGIEPVGPVPTLMADTPVSTPSGYRKAGDLIRGDLVMTKAGEVVPVLQTVSRTLPAFGCFRPLELRAPYFGLKESIRVSPLQRLVLAGSDVEYLFNHEAVLVPARHMINTAAVRKIAARPLISYVQVLLPNHDTLDTAGAELDSLFIGRLHRKRELLEASVLSHCERRTLPDHGASVLPVLKEFDALILAERWAA